MMEIQYASHWRPGFHLGLLGWCNLGHLPCGWGQREQQALRLLAPKYLKGFDTKEPAWGTLRLESYQMPVDRPTVLWPKNGKLVVY
jgi:hypothetical protein